MRRKLGIKLNLSNLPKIRFGRVSLYTLGGVVILILGAFYLVIVNVNANKGFSLKTLASQQQSLQGENERLAVEAARLKSLAVIDQSLSSAPSILAPTESNLTSVAPTGNSVTTQSINPRVVSLMVPTTQLQYLPQISPLASATR
jgi:hypothetical protein